MNEYLKIDFFDYTFDQRNTKNVNQQIYTVSQI